MLRVEDDPVQGIDIIFVFFSVGGKFQFKNGFAVVVVEFPVVKNGIGGIHACVCEGDLLCLFQGDIRGRGAVSCIIRIIVVIINGHDAGGKAEILHGFPGAGADLFQEPVVGNDGTGLDLNDDVFPAAVDILDEVSGFVDLYDQVSQDVVALFADVILIGSDDGSAVVILAGQADHKAFFVIFDADLRIDAQGKKTGILNGGSRCDRSLGGRGSASGQECCRQNSHGKYCCK